jgi:hypothetical protein
VSGPIERELRAGRARITSEGDVIPITSWYPVKLDDLLDGDIPDTPPVYFPRTDGKAFLYEDQSHVFWGPSGSLKSFAAMVAAASVVGEGRSVLYVDFEMNKRRFVQRARILGIPDAMLRSNAKSRLYYVRPDDSFAGVREQEFRSVGEAANPALIVLDGISIAYALHGKDPMSTRDSAEMQRRLSFPCSTLAIDHTAKGPAGKRSGSGAFGAQQKRAGVDVEIEFVSRRSGGHNGQSLSDLYVTKDRDGYIEEFATDGYVGRFMVDSSPWSKGGSVRLDPPSGGQPKDEQERAVANRRDRIVEFLQSNPGSSGKQVVAGIKGRKDDVYALLAVLEADGTVTNDGSEARPAYRIPEND